MKKDSKSIKKDYDKLKEKHGNDDYLYREYYGIFYKKGVLKIDSKRLKKTLGKKINLDFDYSRNSVYYTPTKRHKYDYSMNYFIDAIEKSRKIWYDQKNNSQKILEDFVKKQKEKKCKDYDFQFQCGVIDYEELCSSREMEKIVHDARVKVEISNMIDYVLDTLFLETIQQIASHLEHAMILTMQKNGFRGDRCSRNDIYEFMDGRIGNSREKIRSLEHFDDYDKFYSIWNFTKHNSPSTYNKIKNKWPELLYTKEKDKWFKLDFPSDQLAIMYLNINEKIISSWFGPLLEFYYEFCELCYGEKKYHSKWDYDDYFIEIVDSYINEEREVIDNPWGLSNYL